MIIEHFYFSTLVTGWLLDTSILNTYYMHYPMYFASNITTSCDQSELCYNKIE